MVTSTSARDIKETMKRQYGYNKKRSFLWQLSFNTVLRC